MNGGEDERMNTKPEWGRKPRRGGNANGGGETIEQTQDGNGDGSGNENRLGAGAETGMRTGNGRGVATGTEAGTATANMMEKEGGGGKL